MSTEEMVVGLLFLFVICFVLFKSHCQHCGVVNAKEGLHHYEGCPLHSRPIHHRHVAPAPPRCGGCVLHNIYTILKDEEQGKWTEPIPGTQFKVNPARLRFCQNSISRTFRDGSSVFNHPRFIPKIAACYHKNGDGMWLFALNNRTLFNALYCNLREVVVNIVEKPDDWHYRFTGVQPWMCIKVRDIKSQGGIDRQVLRLEDFERQALRIPATAFPGGEQRSPILVVLEVRNLVNPSSESFLDLLMDMSSELYVQSVDGPRAFARVRVYQSDVPLVRSMAKALAQRKGKSVRKVTCTEVEEMRLYASPRD